MYNLSQRLWTRCEASSDASLRLNGASCRQSLLLSHFQRKPTLNIQYAIGVYGRPRLAVKAKTRFSECSRGFPPSCRDGVVGIDPFYEARRPMSWRKTCPDNILRQMAKYRQSLTSRRGGVRMRERRHSRGRCRKNATIVAATRYAQDPPSAADRSSRVLTPLPRTGSMRLRETLESGATAL